MFMMTRVLNPFQYLNKTSGSLGGSSLDIESTTAET